MSRCFPYVPTGNLKQGLVESTKLKGENFLPKPILHKKREKVKRERKQKEKIGGIRKEFKKLDDGLNGFKDEQLENSDLTEEHGQAVCYMSDGTQNNRNKNKRKTEALVASSSECKINAEISNGKIKLRFSLKKPREPDASPGEALVCSTSGRAELKPQIQCFPSNNNANSITYAPEQKPSLDSSRRDQISLSSGTSVHDHGMEQEELLYKTFIEDWVPVPLEYENGGENNDDDWLFTKKQQGNPRVKRFKVDDEHEEIKSCSTASWPRANFLAGADIYALPYTVPF